MGANTSRKLIVGLIGVESAGGVLRNKEGVIVVGKESVRIRLYFEH